MEIEITTVNYEEFLPVITKLINEVYVDELGYFRERYKEDHYDRYSIHMLASCENEYIGYIRIIRPNPDGFPALEIAPISEHIYNPDESVELGRLFVKRDYRSQHKKVGLQLMIAAFEYTIKEGYRSIIVDAFIECKYGVVKFYRVLGFKPLSEVYYDHRYYSENTLSQVMILDILEAVRKYNAYKYIVNSIGSETITRYLSSTCVEATV